MGGSWWSGIGAANVDVSTTGLNRDVIIRNQLHNGYLNYFLVSGIFGLISVLSLLWLGLMYAWNAARRSLTPEDRMVGLGVFLGILAAVVMSMAGGVINDAFIVPVVGVLIGLAPPVLAAQPFARTVNTTRSRTAPDLEGAPA
jgi:O-antigen ligase